MRLTTRKTMRTLAVAVAMTTAFGLAACTSQSGGGGGEDAETAEAVSWPSDDIRFIVPFAPGGSTTPVAREFVRQLEEKTGMKGIVENLPGGDQAIGITQVIQSDKDGLTIGMATTAGLVVQPMLTSGLAFNGPDDYDTIAHMITGPYGYIVAGDSPYNTLDDLIADAKANPGKLNIGSTGTNVDPSHSLYALEEEAGFKSTLVPFSGGAGEATLAVMSGEIDAAVVTVSAQLGLLESGDIKLLAHTGTKAYNDKVGGVPGLAELGYDNPFAAEYILIAPPGLPDDIRASLEEVSMEIIGGEEWAQWADEQSFLVGTGGSGSQLSDFMSGYTTAVTDAIELGKTRG
jgi:putative tricarboxylic transport membrane protein